MSTFHKLAAGKALECFDDLDVQFVPGARRPPPPCGG